MEYLFSASVGLTLFIIALILGKQPKVQSDYILLSWLLVFAINFVSFLILHRQQSEFSILQLVILEFTEASIFLHGPLLLFYSLSLIRISFSFKPHLTWHFIPFVFSFILLLIPLFQDSEFNPYFRNILLAGKMISLAMYVGSVLKMLYTHKANVEEIFSNTHMKYLTWLMVISWGVLIIWSIATVSLLLERVWNYNIPQFGGAITNAALCVFVFIMGYFGIRQPSLFHELVYEDELEKDKSEAHKTSKYKKSGLSAEESSRLHKKVLSYIELEKPFLNPDLSLYSLAKQLEVPPNHLSQIINSFEKKNFFCFINTYRIEHFKKIIENDEKSHLSLLGIAYDSGFNSKTSFNRIFKQIVGETPSQYKNRLKG